MDGLITGQPNPFNISRKLTPSIPVGSIGIVGLFLPFFIYLNPSGADVDELACVCTYVICIRCGLSSFGFTWYHRIERINACPYVIYYYSNIYGNIFHENCVHVELHILITGFKRALGQFKIIRVREKRSNLK